MSMKASFKVPVIGDVLMSYGRMAERHNFGPGALFLVVGLPEPMPAAGAWRFRAYIIVEPRSLTDTSGRFVTLSLAGLSIDWVYVLHASEWLDEAWVLHEVV